MLLDFAKRALEDPIKSISLQAANLTKGFDFLDLKQVGKGYLETYDQRLLPSESKAQDIGRNIAMAGEALPQASWIDDTLRTVPLALGVLARTPSLLNAKKATNLKIPEKIIETKFLNKLQSNLPEAVNFYKAKFGKVLNTDNVRELSEDYNKAKATLSKAVHEPASAFVKYMNALAGSCTAR